MSDLQHRRYDSWRDDENKDGVLNNNKEFLFKHPSTESIYRHRQKDISQMSSRSTDQYKEHSTDFRKPTLFSALQQQDIHNSAAISRERQPYYHDLNRTLPSHNRRTHIDESQNDSPRGSDCTLWAPHKVRQSPDNLTAAMTPEKVNHHWHAHWGLSKSQLLSSKGKTRSNSKDREMSRSAFHIHRSTDSGTSAYGDGWTKDVGGRINEGYSCDILDETSQRDMSGYSHNFSRVNSCELESSLSHRQHSTSKLKHKTISTGNNHGQPSQKVQPQYDFQKHNRNNGQHPVCHEMAVYERYNKEDHGYHSNTSVNSDLLNTSTSRPNPSSYNYNNNILPKRGSYPKNINDLTTPVKEDALTTHITTTLANGAKINGNFTNSKRSMNSRNSKFSPRYDTNGNANSGKLQMDIPDVLIFQGNNNSRNWYASPKQGEMNVDAGRELREQFDDKQKRRRNHVIFLLVMLFIIAIAVISAVLASTLKGGAELSIEEGWLLKKMKRRKGGKSPKPSPTYFTAVKANLTLKILNRDFDADLLTFGSAAFQNLAIPYTIELDELFLKSSLAHVYSRNEMISFRNGSIYATSSFTFADTGLISSPKDVENVIESADVARDWKTSDAVQLGEFVVCRSCAEASVDYVKVKVQPEIMLHTIDSETSTVAETTSTTMKRQSTTISSTPSSFSTTTDEILISDRPVTSINTTSSTAEINSTSPASQSESTTATTTTNLTTSLSTGEISTTEEITTSRKEESTTTTIKTFSTISMEETTATQEWAKPTTQGVTKETTTTTILAALTTSSEIATATTTAATLTISSKETTPTTTEEMTTEAITSSTIANEERTSQSTTPTFSRKDPATNTTFTSIGTTNTSPKPSPTVITMSDMKTTTTAGFVILTCYIANPNDFLAVNILHTPVWNSNGSKDNTRTMVTLHSRDVYGDTTPGPVYKSRLRITYEISASHIELNLNISDIGCYDDGYIECSLLGRTVPKTSGRGRLEVIELPSTPELVMPVEVVANVEMTDPIRCQADVGYPAWSLKMTAQMTGAAVPLELLTEQEKMVNGCRTTVILRLQAYTPTYSSNGTIIRCELERTGENMGIGDVKAATGVLLVVGGSVCKAKADNTILRHPYNCSLYITCLNHQPKVSSCPPGQCFDTVSGLCGMKAVIVESTNGFLNEGLAGVTCSVIHVSDWSEITIEREISLSKSYNIMSVSSTGNVTWHDTSLSTRAISNIRLNSLEVVFEMWLYVLKCSDEGAYTCTVRGPTPVKAGRAELKVYAKPEPPKLVVPLTVVENNPQPPGITCEATLGRPAAIMTLMRRLPNQINFEPVSFTDSPKDNPNACISKSKRAYVTPTSEWLNGTIFRCDVESSPEVPEKIHLSSEEIDLYILTSKMCQGVGSTLLVHPKDCRYFVQCVQAETTILSCGPGLCFNVMTQQCDILTPTTSPFAMDEACTQENSTVFQPHTLLCNKYFRCEAGRQITEHCPQGQLYSTNGSCTSNIHDSFCFNANVA